MIYKSIKKQRIERKITNEKNIYKQIKRDPLKTMSSADNDCKKHSKQTQKGGKVEEKRINSSLFKLQ